MQDLSAWESIPASNKSKAFRKRILGVGVNDVDFVTETKINGKRATHPAMIVWNAMLTRAYSPRYLETRPTYTGVTVCKEWLSFSAFLGWWHKNQVEGWHLDKDILTDTKMYAPESCIYIPQWLNSLLNDHGHQRGPYMLGVSIKSNGRFSSRCNNPITAESEWLGTFDYETAAHRAWRKRKLEHAETLKPDMDAIDIRIYPRVVEIIKAMR